MTSDSAAPMPVAAAAVNTPRQLDVHSFYWPERSVDTELLGFQGSPRGNETVRSRSRQFR